jgi:hypothetical protein
MANFIAESVIFQEAQDLKLLKANKARFKMIMQTVDEENQNHRIYPKSVLVQGLMEMKDKIKNRAFLNELDHPLPSGNNDFDAIRQTQVSLEKVSHILLDYEFQENNIVGELETTQTPMGNILLGLLKDRAGIGLSLRAMAELERNYKTGVSTVKGPIYVVCYDAVSNPSHKSAVVNFNEMTFEARTICESKSGLICIGNRCFTAGHFDKLIETKMIKFFTRWI